MEDPWINAWGDPQKSEQPSNPPITSTWTTSSKFVTDDQADIAIPSWEAESGTIWDNSPDLHKDMWSRDNRISQLWATPTLDSIGFAKPPQELQPEVSPRTPSPQGHGIGSSGVGEGQEIYPTPGAENFVVFRPPIPDSEEETQKPGLHAQSSPAAVLRKLQEDENALGETSPDPDGFGTFEAAANDYPQSDPWTSSQSALTPMEQAEDWGTAWKGSDEIADNGTEPIDEWEMAKRQKEIQDQYVPPELLNSILCQFDEFAGAYWPDEHSNAITSPYSHSSGELAETLGINSIIERLIPLDLTLPAPVAFAKTFISKEMVEGIKLTRHHIITRNGPLAVYMSSKGALSWEAAIKSQRDVTEADVVPSGWRIVPKEKADQHLSVNDTKKKPVGGLLSFFGRKTATIPQTPNSSPPARTDTPGAVSPRSTTASPHPSLETNATTSVVAKSGPPSPKGSDPRSSATMSAIAEISNTGKEVSNPVTHIQLAEETPQPQSAVSRFLERFSRSAKSSGSPRSSVALSSDDIEFLSDIVPSAGDMEETDQLDALSEMIRTPPVPTKLPPPLAPPPRLPPPPKPPASAGSKAITPIPQHSDTRDTSRREPSENQLFGLDFGFSSLQTQPHAQTTSVPSSQALTPLPRPPVPSISPSPLPPPLSPATTGSRPYTQTKTAVTVPPSIDSLFDDDEFSDFQTSLSSTSSAPLVSLDSAFASFTAPAPLNPHSVSFDDLDDIVTQDPPQVPEKPKLTSCQTIPAPAPSIFPPPSGSPLRPSTPIKSSSPPKQSIHARRVSRQAESHQRTLSLLETAAAKGKWPAPPSPLPNAIPPPSAKSGPKLFDVFGEPSGSVPINITPVQSGSSSGAGQLISDLASSPSVVAPSRSSVLNEIPVSFSNGIFSERATGTPQVARIPPPSAFPQSPTQSTPSQYPQSQIQSNLHQWRLPSPPTGKPPPSSTFGFVQAHENSGNASSRSRTPFQRISQQQPQFNQQQSLPGSFATLAPAPLTSQPSGPSDKNPGSGGLSAQDLSFFESL